MEPLYGLLKVVLGGKGSYVLMSVRNSDWEITSDIKESIFNEFTRNATQIEILFTQKPCFYEKLGLLHVKRILYSGAHHEFGCLISGKVKTLVLERVLHEFSEFARESDGQTLFYLSRADVQRMVHSFEHRDINAVPDVFEVRSRCTSAFFRKSTFKGATIIGQLNKEFIIAAQADYVFAVDQHALHERVLLEDLLSTTDVDMYANSSTLEELKTMACRNAIKFGDVVSMGRLKNLVASMSGLKFPAACAHGRISVCILMTKSSLDTIAAHPWTCPGPGMP